MVAATPVARRVGCPAAMFRLSRPLRLFLHCAALVCCCAGGLVATAAWPQAKQQAASYHLRVVGGLADLSQYTRREEPFWTRELPRLSGGRYIAEIVPFDRGERNHRVHRLRPRRPLPVHRRVPGVRFQENFIPPPW
eukprot:gene30543-37782_t